MDVYCGRHGSYCKVLFVESFVGPVETLIGLPVFCVVGLLGLLFWVGLFSSPSVAVFYSEGGRSPVFLNFLYFSGLSSFY